MVWQSSNTLLTLLSPTTPGGMNAGTLDRLMQIEEDIIMKSIRVTWKSKRIKDLKRTTREVKHCDEAIRADGYVDNSPLRSEFTTYPQPLKERLAQTDRTISSWVTHKQPPPDLCFAVLQRLLVDNPSIGLLKTRRH